MGDMRLQKDAEAGRAGFGTRRRALWIFVHISQKRSAQDWPETCSQTQEG